MMLPFLYAGFFFLILFQLRLVNKAAKEYRLPWLKDYRFYLIIFFMYGFIKFIGVIFLYESFYERIDENIIASQIALLIFPFAALEFYAMLLWIRKLTGRDIKPPLKITYWAVQGFLLAYMVLTIIPYSNSQNADWMRLWTTIHVAEWLILLVIIVQLFFIPKSIKAKRRIRFAMSLGLIYLGSFGIFEAFQTFSPPYLSDRPLHYYAISGGIYFTINIPALMFILHVLYYHLPEMADIPFAENDLDRFYLAYNITPREKEVIELILIGKSNQEIGERLFISKQTVKNINSNIYKKINVKNRIQLFHRVQEFGRPV